MIFLALGFSAWGCFSGEDDSLSTSTAGCIGVPSVPTLLPLAPSLSLSGALHQLDPSLLPSEALDPAHRDMQSDVKLFADLRVSALYHPEFGEPLTPDGLPFDLWSAAAGPSSSSGKSGPARRPAR